MTLADPAAPAGGPTAIDTAAGAWERLAEELGASPFERPGWARAWWDAFGSGTLELHAVGGADLRAVLATRRVGGRRLSLTNWHSVRSGLLARDEAAVAELATQLVADRPRTLTLQFLDQDAWETRALEAGLTGCGYLVHIRPLEQPPFVAIEGDYASFEQGVSKNLRGDVRRRRRRLEEAGAVSVEIADGTAGLDELLEEGLAVEGSGWKTEAGTAIVSHADTDRFYRSLARWASAEGCLDLAFLRLDGRSIAFHFNLEAEGVVYHLKGGYDPAYERFSPGKLLHAALLERAFALGLSRYEFLGADEPYKLQWATGSRRTATLHAFAPTGAGKAAWLIHRHGRPLATRALAVARRGGKDGHRSNPTDSGAV